MPDGRRTRLLVVEDDFPTASALIQGLTRAGFDVSLSSGEGDGMSRSLSGQYDLVIVDLEVMGRCGLDMIRAWRGRTSIPIIALAARVERRSTLEALALGAADCVTKPVWMDELIARIRVRLHLSVEHHRRVLAWADVELDVDARSVRRSGHELPLTSHEFNILAWLAEHPHRAIRRRELAERALSPGGETSDRTVDSHISRLRHKLGDTASLAIHTVRGVGYRFDPAEGEG